MHITYSVCFYGVCSAVFKEIKNNILLDTLQIFKKISTRILGLRNFSENFRIHAHFLHTTCSICWSSMEFSTVFKEVKTTEKLSTIFEKHTLHANYPYYKLLYYLALSFKKEKTTHFWILQKFSWKFQHTFWDLEFFLKILKYTHISCIQHAKLHRNIYYMLYA